LHGSLLDANVTFELRQSRYIYVFSILDMVVSHN